MSECLIDFDPFPQCPIWYDDGRTVEDDWNQRETFSDVYAAQEEYRHAKRRQTLRLLMCQRLLTEAEETEAHNYGEWLTGSDYKLLSDLWFQQRRLKAIERGELLK